MTDKLTIKEIAKRAGVGTTTVSRVLNNHPYVSEEKRQKVLAAIEETGYRPNYNARWLRGGSSGLIGFLTDEVATTPFAVDVIRGAQEAAFEQDCVLLVMNTGPNLQSARAAVEFLLERQVFGIIYAAMFHRVVQLPENIHQVPVAMANCYIADRSLPSAVPDEFIGGYRATRTLLAAGHRRIAFLNVTPPAVDAADGRLAGYKHALAEFDVPYDDALIKAASESARLNYETTSQLLDLPNPPTGFFAGNDRTAMSCYSAIRERGLRIPEDVGVVGFDNQQSIAENLIPPLTTLQLPHYEMGRWAFDKVISDEWDVPEQQVIDCPLILRDSV
ncbi:MAG: LacI family DNA-binding transcriptional regulator [Anaerolineae bacterium]